MTIRHQIEVESFSLLILAAVVGSAFAFYNSSRIHPQVKVLLPAMQTYQNIIDQSTVSPTPTETPKPQAFSQISPDGENQISMTIVQNADLSKTYVFNTSDANGGNQHNVYTASYADDKNSMAIPFNTWSPDNKYVFVNHIDPSGVEAIVLKANGELITEKDASISATTVFKEKITDNIYDEITGWASETLLLVNTKNSAGEKSTSYWFEVPTMAIIPLSTQF